MTGRTRGVGDESPWATASMWITSVETPVEVITTLVGLEPSLVLPRGLAFRHFNEWAYRSRCADQSPIETHIGGLLDAFGGADRIAKLPADCSATLRLSLPVLKGERILYTLDANTLDRIGRLPAALQIDLYQGPPDQHRALPGHPGFR